MTFATTYSPIKEIPVTSVTVTETVAASAQDVWTVLSDFGGIELLQWYQRLPLEFGQCIECDIFVLHKLPQNA